MLAEAAFKLAGDAQACFHGYLAGQLDIAVGELFVFGEHLLCLLKKMLDSL